MSLPPDPVPLLSTLVRQPSVSGEEGPALAALAAWLEEHGVSPHIEGRNLLARVGDPTGSRLLLNAHMDTVPEGPGWTRPPFGGEIEGDRLFGRGANDNKSSVAAMASAVASLVGEDLPGEVVFAATGDEETGGEGLEWLLPRLPAVDQALLAEPTDMRVAVGQRGLVRLVAKVAGRTAHASRPWEGRNAIRLALEDLVRLQAIELSESHQLLGRATLEVTMIEGGSAANVLPGECTFTLDGRPTPRYDNDYFEKEIRAALENAEIVTLKRRMTPVALPADSPVARAALSATSTKETVSLGGVSDLFFVRHLPAAVVGPGTPEQSHAPDESVSVSATRRACEVYRSIALTTLSEIGT